MLGAPNSIPLISSQLCFAPREVAALTAEPAEKQQYRLFEHWTLKNAYIKARGIGLALPLHKLGLHYSDNHSVKITIDPDLDDDAARWMTTSLQSSS